jgi:putative cell wall-binding protein
MKHRTKVIFAAVAACIAVAMLPAPALAISRDVVLDRGKVWANYVRSVDKAGKKTTGVLYSQSRWAYENGSMVSTKTASPSTVGYRTDCSGFASLCWNLRDSKGRPRSGTTAEFGAKGNKTFFQITKAQLTPGDAILKSTVWGAPTGHVIIFAGWVDATQKQYWALEQTTSSSHNGTILHPRTYGESYYRPYRYSGLDDMYADVEETVVSEDGYHAAVAAADAQYPTSHTPTVPMLVVVNGGSWGDQVAAAAIAGAGHGPVLLTSATSLPSVTNASIKRFKPKRVFIVGSTAMVSAAVQAKIAAICPSVARIGGKNSFETAANSLSTVVAESKGTTHPVDTVYVASGDKNADALSIAPVLARVSRPVVYVHATSIPDITLKKLKAAKIKKVVILGSTSVVGTTVEKALAKAGYKVSRVGGTDAYKSSVAIANYAAGLKAGFTWKRVAISSAAACTDILAWSTANGASGTLCLLTPSSSLHTTVKATVIAHRKDIGKARVFGNTASVSQATRKSLATALRSGK